MQVNKSGIAIDTPKKRQKPNFKLDKVNMVKKEETITIPNFQPLKQVMTAYGWELR